MKRISNDDKGNIIILDEGQHGTTIYDNVESCNSVAKYSLEKWLDENCKSSWNKSELNILAGTGNSGLNTYIFNANAEMRDGRQLKLSAQFYGVKLTNII